MRLSHSSSSSSTSYRRRLQGVGRQELYQAIPMQRRTFTCASELLPGQDNNSRSHHSTTEQQRSDSGWGSCCEARHALACAIRASRSPCPSP
jgi:hypothetical protein